MSYRLRISLVMAAAVMAACIAAALAVFLSFRGALYSEVDARLVDDSRFLQRYAQQSERIPTPPRRPGSPMVITQVVGSDGKVDRDRVIDSGGFQMQPRMHVGDTDDGAMRRPSPPPSGEGGGGRFGRIPSPYVMARTSMPVLKVTDATREVLKGKSAQSFENQTVEDTHVRVMAFPIQGGSTVQLARSVEEFDASLSTARSILVVIVAIAAGIAGVLGWVLMNFSFTPIRHLGEHMAEVANSNDLSLRIDEPSNDEIGKLAARFNNVLDALASSRKLQQQLVEDASHELRTPLTSIKTNLEVLALSKPDDPRQKQILADVDVQIDELSDLVANLVELAHGNSDEEEIVDMDLAEVVAESVASARRNAAGKVTFSVQDAPCTIRADRARIRSAVDNVLSNAVKWSPDGGVVSVWVDRGTVTVSDQGPGISPPDLPHIFDRFYRSPEARGTPGSGLGLSIVKATATHYGGWVSAGTVPGAGATITLFIPPVA